MVRQQRHRVHAVWWGVNRRVGRGRRSGQPAPSARASGCIGAQAALGHVALHRLHAKMRSGPRRFISVSISVERGGKPRSGARDGTHSNSDKTCWRAPKRAGQRGGQADGLDAESLDPPSRSARSAAGSDGRHRAWAAAVPTRMACATPSTRWNTRSRREAPRPRCCQLFAQTVRRAAR